MFHLQDDILLHRAQTLIQIFFLNYSFVLFYETKLQYYDQILILKLYILACISTYMKSIYTNKIYNTVIVKVSLD